jgi:flagellar hook-basal body complex protein FliE
MMDDRLTISSKSLIPPSVPDIKKSTSAAQAAEKGFGTVLKDAIQDINKLQMDADAAITKVQVDKTGSIHEAMIALEKADISFRAMLQVRNKIIDAYQEVMRMSV